MMGAFSELMSGERSRQGEASRLDAVLDPPPGDWMDLREREESQDKRLAEYRK